MRNKHILIFFLLLIIISCENDDKVIDQISEQANKLDGTWKIKGSNSVIFNGQNVNSFSSMTLNFSNSSIDGGNFSTTHNEANGTEVWPFNGSWSFLKTADKNDPNVIIYDKNTIVRSDMIAMDIIITESTLRLSFRVADCIYICSPNSYDGDWVFDFEKQ